MGIVGGVEHGRDLLLLDDVDCMDNNYFFYEKAENTYKANNFSIGKYMY
jgi:hypothetical protein